MGRKVPDKMEQPTVNLEYTSPSPNKPQGLAILKAIGLAPLDKDYIEILREKISKEIEDAKETDSG